MGGRFKIKKNQQSKEGLPQQQGQSKGSFHLDEIDLALLERLQRSAKTTNAQLAAEVSLSPAATLERVRKLEATGIIQSYHARLDPQVLGLNVQFMVQVKLKAIDASSMEEFETAIQAIPQIVDAFQITGDNAILLKVLAPDLPSFQAFLANHLGKLPMVDSVSSQLVLKTMKENTPLPIQ